MDLDFYALLASSFGFYADCIICGQTASTNIGKERLQIAAFAILSSQGDLSVKTVLSINWIINHLMQVSADLTSIIKEIAAKSYLCRS